MNRQVSVRTLKTSVFKVGENLDQFLVERLRNESDLENSVLAITSKIVSLAENRLVKKTDVEKEKLVRQESDLYLGEIGYGCYLTIKHGLFIPSAGIDESNSEEDAYILYPKDPFATALRIRNTLAQEFNLKNFGVILTDSHTSPLRAGVTGVSLAHAGFHGVDNKIGQNDLFGRQLKMTRINVADALAVSAVFCMGEADESSPLALISAPVTFLPDGASFAYERECSIPPELDLYSPLYKERL